jgi:asparagine synthase (glutamine-hydrolysing)
LCGIVGIWEFEGRVDEGLLRSMRDRLTHRGPDDEGTMVGDYGRIGLGHRRLSILDLSPAGHQPMARNGVWTVHNGEIYNFREIRKRLADQGHPFESTSDTEVILEGFLEWGLDVVHEFRGMFATAIWDSTTRRLHLLRDRAGVKPLYYYKDDQRFIFASEMRAILRHPAVAREVDQGALALYLKLGYVPAPRSIFRNIAKLEAGHLLTVDEHGQLKDRSYWDALACFGQPKKKDISEEEALDELEDLLIDSFKLRMVSDVPVGVFLSGGIDSATVAALLQKDAGDKIRTFTIGFSDEAYNEADSAKRVAEYLGTDHHELYLEPREALNIIPDLPEIYDEPFGDTSGIPTFMVSRFAREHVKVALSADGGDELFAGYSAHTRLLKAWRTLTKLGPFRGVALGIADTPIGKRILQKQQGSADLKVRKLRASLKGRWNKTNFFWAGRSLWTDAEISKLMDWEFDPTTKFMAPYFGFEAGSGGFINFMRAADYKTYLADDILVKVDRASMAVGLESREPFLDHYIAEFAAGLPDDFLIRNGEKKYLLKQLLYRHVPRELVDRPKRGFAVPLDLWLKGDLRHLLTDYINEHRIRDGGTFDWPTVKTELDDFLQGRIPSSTRLWLLLEYEMWHDRWCR